MNGHAHGCLRGEAWPYDGASGELSCLWMHQFGSRMLPEFYALAIKTVTMG